jgi:hypothetical protein
MREFHIIRQAGEVLRGRGQIAKDRVGIVEVVIAVTDGRDTPGLTVRGRVRLLDVLGDVGVGEVIIPLLGRLTLLGLVGVIRSSGFSFVRSCPHAATTRRRPLG